MTEKANFYVSTSGNDEWSGTFPEANSDLTDGPFASLAKAKDAVRTLKNNSDTDITVFIRDGQYLIDETVVFGLEDSGNSTQKITYAAYPGETPVFTSGIPVKAWQKLEEYPTDLPEAAKGNVFVADIPKQIKRFFVMFDGEKMLPRTHGEIFQPTAVEYENVDSINVAREEDRYLLRRVEFPEGKIKNWENLDDIELRFTPVPWTLNILPLEAVDEEKCVATLAVEATTPPGAKCKWGMRVENVIDYLDAPGKWCVNTHERKIYYWPENDSPGENIVVPCLKELIRVEGDVDYDGPVDTPVKNLVFKGLTFMHGDRDQTYKDYKGGGIQNDWEMFDKGTALMRFRGAEDCIVKECRFTATGGTALRLDLHCQNITVTKSLFDYIGAMGILLCGYGPGTKDVNKNNKIINNILHHCGEEVWHGHAVFLWQSGSNLIANNCIHHTARKAIGLCGIRITILENRQHKFDEAVKSIRWNEIDATIASEGDNFDRFMPYLHCRNNLIKENEVYYPLQKLGDGATLNVSGAGEGNVLENNYIHHNSTYDASSVLRVDDWQRGTTFKNNIVYMSNTGALTRKNLNHIVNNIFIDVNCKGYLRFASYPNEKEAYGSKVRNNIFYESGPDAEFYKPAYLASPDVTLPKHCDADYNIFYTAANPEYAKQELAEYREDGIEAHSIVADPLFKDIKNQDFSLKPESPALKLGFNPISMDNIGISEDYPEHFRKLDYSSPVDPKVFTRGRDPEKEGYEWW